MTAFIKDILREITYSFGRFLGILVIAALGAAFFAGIGSTGIDMKITGEEYYKSQNLFDIQVISTIGLNKRDIKAIEELEIVEDIYPSHTIDGVVSVADSEIVVKAHSLDINTSYKDKMNKVYMLSGRYPEKINEVLVEDRFLSLTGLEIGDTFTLESGKDRDSRNELETNQFTITGTSYTPLYLSEDRGTGSVGSGTVNAYVLLPREVFSSSLYTEAYITIKKAKDYVFYDKKYEDLIEDSIKVIEDIGEDRVDTREIHMVSDAYKDLDSGEKELYQEERNIYRNIEEARKIIKEGKKQLKEETFNLDTGYSEISKNKRELDGYISKIEQGIEEIHRNISEIENQIKSLEYEKQQLLLHKNQIEEDKFNKNKEEIEIGIDKLKSALSIMEQEKNDLKKQVEELYKNRKEIHKAYNSLLDGEKTIIGKEREIEETKEKLKEEEVSGKRIIEEKREEITDTRKDLDDLLKPKWYVLDRNSIIGYAGYEDDSERIESIGRVFPVIFYIVAALVSLTTITRLVDERRTEIGTLKSLGYGNTMIMSKYSIYAFLPTIIGGSIGGYIGMKTLPVVIIDAYGMLYQIPGKITPAHRDIWFLSVFMGLIATLLAAVFSSINELREVPAELMRPKAPKAGQRVILERIKPLWNRLSFFYKVTIRNIFRYKKRFFMTVAGIGGCTALIITGFGIKDSISDIVYYQFSDIYTYDMTIDFADGTKNKDIKNVEEELLLKSEVSDYLTLKNKMIDTVKKNGELFPASIMIVEDLSKIDDFISLRERVSKKPIEISNDGVVITEKLATLHEIEVGDTITLDYKDKYIDVPVTDITEQYFLHNVYMTEEFFWDIYKEKVEYNSIFVLVPTEDERARDKLLEDILDYKNVSSATFISGLIDEFTDIIDNLNFVVYILIFSAAALAFVVLLNLTNINISERARELATIKVLGFYDKEVEEYIFRENVILTLIGILLGLFMGYFLHQYLILTLEVDMMMFGRKVAPISYLYSFLLTIVFSYTVNLLTRSKLHNIDMVEALKSVE